MLGRPGHKWDDKINLTGIRNGLELTGLGQNPLLVSWENVLDIWAP
jgi:hypothetical protein